MTTPPINPIEVKRFAKQIAHSKNTKAAVVELLGAPDSEKRKQLDPAFVKAVLSRANKIIKKESGQPALHPIKAWGFVQMIKGIQGRIEKPGEASLESANQALERELWQMHFEDYLDVCRAAQSLLQMYEYALPPEVKGDRDPENPICSEGTQKYFYKKLKDKHDAINYLELDLNAIASKCSLAALMLTEANNEKLVDCSLHMPDLDLNNVTNIFSPLTYMQKKDLISAYFMNPDSTGSELSSLMKSLFALSNGLNKEVKIEQGKEGTDPEEVTELTSSQEPLSKQLREDINNITQNVGKLLYIQAITFPGEIDTSSNYDSDDDDDESGGIGLFDDSESGMTPFATNQLAKQYVLDRQEILIAGMEEHVFDIPFEDKLGLFPLVNDDEHRLRLATILINDVEGESDVSKVEKILLNEITNEDLSDGTGFRASNAVVSYALLKRADAVDKLVEFLDHDDHLVKYQAFKKLCDEDVTGVPGGNALVEKIEKDIRSGSPSWSLAALCKYSSNQYNSEIGEQDKYRALFIRVLMLKDIDIKDAFKKLDGLEVPFTINLGEPSPGALEPLDLYEVIDYIGLPELVDITINSPQKTIRDNARKILEVLLEEDPQALDNFMKTDELADSLRKAIGIAHASGVKIKRAID